MIDDATTALAAHPEDPALRNAVRKAEIAVRMSKYYDAARQLSHHLTDWSVNKQGGRRYVISSGGGPGIMEAANRGASEVKGGRSVGLGISLPFEQGVNQYVSEELAFEFHYFFTRKYWFLYLCKALVIFPGGYGTLDELFEVLTLVQTGKMVRIPIVVAGSLIPHKSGVVKRRRRVGAGGAVNGTRAARVGPRCAGGRGSIRTTDRRTAARPA